MVRIDWNQFFHDYSIFGLWKPIVRADANGNYIYAWEWSKPVYPEPWHGCHRVREMDDYRE